MLLKSVCLQLLLCILTNAQHYESEYSVSEDNDGNHAEDDYSKYFNSPYSAPLEEGSDNGFVKPLEFSTFFSSPQFGSSHVQDEVPAIPSEIQNSADFTEGFGDRAVDYFDEAQKESKNEENAEAITPSYVSKNVKIPGGYQREINSFRQKNPSFTHPSTGSAKFKPSSVDPSRNQYTKYTNTPYQKYSLQPQTNSYGLGPYNPSYLRTASLADLNYEHLPTQIVPQNLKLGDCVKVHKASSDKMNCYVCKNPKSGVKSEHCSYEQEPKAYYRSMTKTYNQPDAYRNKRDSDKEEYADPYEEVKAKSHKFFAQPDEFRKKFYSAPDFSEFEQYKFDPGVEKNAEGEERSYSEVQTEEIQKNKDNCKKVQHKNGITCLVCQDSKNGGSFEKCEYQSEPEEQKYAYVRERKYDGEPQEEEEEEVKDESSPVAKEESAAETDDNQEFIEVAKKPKIGSRGIKFKKHRDLTVFPKASESSETRAQPEYYDSTGAKDVERVLDEFVKKNRSNCKQIKKKGMTCYLCIDKKGIQNEECMYVSESQPQRSLVAYHQLERTRDVPDPLPSTKNTNDSESEPSNVKEVKRSREKLEEPKFNVDVNNKSGLYTAETKPVFVKSLGMSLPKYMVEKTSFEKEFDQTVANDRIKF